jgi:hypothetical protein
VLGGSHFSANRPVPVLTLFYENLIAFPIYIYIYIFGLVRTEEVLKIFIFSKLKRLSNMVILADILTIDFNTPVFIIFANYYFLIIYYLNPRPVPGRKSKVVVRSFVIP